MSDFDNGLGLKFNRSDFTPVAAVQAKYKLTDDEMDFVLAKRTLSAAMVDGQLQVPSAQLGGRIPNILEHVRKFRLQKKDESRETDAVPLDSRRYVSAEWLAKWNGQVSVAALLQLMSENAFDSRRDPVSHEMLVDKSSFDRFWRSGNEVRARRAGCPRTLRRSERARKSRPKNKK